MISAVPAAFGYDTARSMLYALKSRFPFARFGVIGRSWAGRAIFSLSIGEGAESVLFASGFSGRESIPRFAYTAFLKDFAYRLKQTASCAPSK